jgi:hypothetical protein
MNKPIILLPLLGILAYNQTFHDITKMLRKQIFGLIPVVA